MIVDWRSSILIELSLLCAPKKSIPVIRACANRFIIAGQKKHYAFAHADRLAHGFLILSGTTAHSFDWTGSGIKRRISQPEGINKFNKLLRLGITAVNKPKKSTRCLARDVETVSTSHPKWENLYFIILY